MTKEVVLKYLQKHGQKIDYEIVKDTGIDLKELRKTISELQSKNLIQTCTIIQHGAKGKLIEGIQCRIAGLQYGTGCLQSIYLLHRVE